MCGIAGIYSYSRVGEVVDEQELTAIRDHMFSRGPDDQGMWFSDDGKIGLAHRRLAIIDLSKKAAQPMKSASGRYVISFNGEIYNYKELRNSLEKEGVRFASDSDTEVLLHLFAKKGVEMLSDLRGMFAFLLWDNEERTLLLARDPYGIKPLYYSNDGTCFRAASQVKGLIAGGRINTSVDPAGLVGFYLFGNVPEPYTIYKSIKALPAGSYILLCDQTTSEPISYCSISKILHNAAAHPLVLEEQAVLEEIREALLDSVKHHLVADVPVGAFLSAGIDSGMLVGLMTECVKEGGENPLTITLGFDEFKNTNDDEVPLAGEVARLYGSRHIIRRISFEEFQCDLSSIISAMDQPSIDGLNSWFVSKAAKENNLKVVLSGLGGDELFGGYPSFREIPLWVKWLSMPSKLPYAGAAFQKTMQALLAGFVGFNPKLPGILRYGGTYSGAYLLKRGLFMPWELPLLMDSEMAEKGLEELSPLFHISRVAESVSPEPFATVSALESCLYMRNQLLRDSDWASMAHSIELRVPLVDATLLKRLAPILCGSCSREGKMFLGNIPRIALPGAICQRKKTGFRTPIHKWMEHIIGAEISVREEKGGRKNWPWARQWAPHVLREQMVCYTGI